MIWKYMEMLCCLGPGVQEGVAGQMGINVTGMFLLAYLCDVLSVSLLNQVYRLGVQKST